MWTFIILVVVFIIGKFLYDANQQSSKVKKEGGMKVKYWELIEALMSGDSRTKVFQETSNSITFGLSNAGGRTIYILTQTFGKVTIQWKVDSPVFGKHSLEWDFPEYGDQQKMVEQVINDAGRYTENIMRARGY